MNLHYTLHFIKNIPHNIRCGIENLIKWFPVIWRDRDWDHIFLYVLIKFKLSEMEKLQRDYGHSANNIKTANEIRLCKNLLDRLIKNEYIENALMFHDKKWGETKFYWTPVVDKEGLSELNISIEKAITEKQKKQESKERKRLYHHSDYMEQQDLDMFCNKFNKQVRGWWD